MADGYYGEYEYAVAQTPCEAVIEERRLIHVPDRVIELYPDDPDLGRLGAVSYLGVPLLDTDGGMLGHLAVLHDAPMAASPRAAAIFRIFAGRAAAELRRVRRDRDLRQREGRLSRLIDSAMDAILHFDEDLSIASMNRVARRAPEMTNHTARCIAGPGNAGTSLITRGKLLPGEWVANGALAIVSAPPLRARDAPQMAGRVPLSSPLLGRFEREARESEHGRVQ